MRGYVGCDLLGGEAGLKRWVAARHDSDGRYIRRSVVGGKAGGALLRQSQGSGVQCR